MEGMQLFIFALIGILAGMAGGMLGIGGAIVIIPALIYIMGFSQQMAQGTTLMMLVLPVGALAAWQYYQSGFVDMKAAMVMAVFFFFGGYFGAKFAVQIPQDLLRKGFAIFMIGLGLKMLFLDK